MEKATLSRYDSFEQLKASNTPIKDQNLVKTYLNAYQKFILHLRVLFIEQVKQKQAQEMHVDTENK